MFKVKVKDTFYKLLSNSPQACHGSVSLTPFPSLLMLSKKDELWRNIQSMRDKENKVDVWISKVEEGDEKDSGFWDFLPDTLILPDEWDR